MKICNLSGVTGTALGLCWALCACANSPVDHPITLAQPSAQSSRPAQMRVLTNAERNHLRQSLSASLSRSTQGLTVERTSTGSNRIDLQNRFQHMSVVTESSDGQLKQRCISSPGELEQLLSEQQEHAHERIGSQP